MKIVAHRGGMLRAFQNTPEGICLAARHGADAVELDVVLGRNGDFRCVHGPGKGSSLRDCLTAMRPGMDLIAHLKGPFPDPVLRHLLAELAVHFSLGKVVFTSHRGRVLRRLSVIDSSAVLARFGLLPALAALWCRPLWQICLVNQIVLSRRLVRALQGRGFLVYASCVWEWRSRSSVESLGVDGAFVNL